MKKLFMALMLCLVSISSFAWRYQEVVNEFNEHYFVAYTEVINGGDYFQLYKKADSQMIPHVRLHIERVYSMRPIADVSFFYNEEWHPHNNLNCVSLNREWVEIIEINEDFINDFKNAEKVVIRFKDDDRAHVLYQFKMRHAEEAWNFCASNNH